MAPKLVDVFNQQRQWVKDELSKQVSDSPETPPVVHSLVNYVPAMVAAILPTLITAYRDGLARAAAEIKLSPGRLNPVDLTAAYRVNLANQAQEAATLVNGTTADRLASSLEEAWEAFATPEGFRPPSQQRALDAIEDAVDEVFDQAVNERAMVIAEHEELKADTAGSTTAAREARKMGVAVKSEWVLGPRPCIRCVRIKEGNPPLIDANSWFYDPLTNSPTYPPVHPRCQCTVVQHGVE